MANSYAEIAQLEPKLQKEALGNESEKDKRSQELGYLGKILGFGSQATINILNIITIIMVIFTCGYLFWGPDTGSIKRSDVLDKVLPILTTLIGIILGKSNLFNKN